MNKQQLIREIIKVGYPGIADHIRHGFLPGNPRASIPQIAVYCEDRGLAKVVPIFNKYIQENE